MKDHCPACHFIVRADAQRCGWCGGALQQRQAAWHWFTQAAPPSAVRTVNATPAEGRTETFIFSDPHLSHTMRAGTATIDLPTAAPSPYTTSHITGQALDWTPPPPVVAPSIASYWWIAVLGALTGLAVLIWFTHAIWGDSLAMIGRMALAGATGMAIWIAAPRAGRAGWRTVRGAGMAAAGCAVVGLLALGSAGTATSWQARQAEARQDYATASMLYAHIHSPSDLTRVQQEWALTLANAGQYGLAATKANTAIQEASPLEVATARATLGHILWLWGEQALQAQDLADARQRLQAAATQAPDSPDGLRAAQALAAPQRVTGRLVWLASAPVPGLRVALVSEWRYDPTLHSAETGGERLSATTGADGSFIIDGARPGVTYALIWEGSDGDYLATDSQGHARYLIQVNPLSGSDMGTIAIDQ